MEEDVYELLYGLSRDKDSSKWLNLLMISPVIYKWLVPASPLTIERLTPTKSFLPRTANNLFCRITNHQTVS